MRLLDGFAPLRGRAFRTLWPAQLASNVGGGMQDVGARYVRTCKEFAETPWATRTTRTKG